MPKQGIIARSWRGHRKLFISLALVGCLSVGLFAVPGVRAATISGLQDKIDNLHSKNSDNKDHISTLEGRAQNYQDAIHKLRQRIGAVHKAISANEAKQARLQKKIDKYQAKIEHQKQVLGDDIKSMYVKGDISSIEMLASSKNLSDFVNAQTYRGSVQRHIQDALKEINKLENQLKDKKTQVQQLVASKKAQQDRLAHDKAKKHRLLALNKKQQQNFNEKIKENKNKINKLKKKQYKIQQRLFAGSVVYGGTGGYPYDNATCMNSDGCGPYSSSPYNWGVNGDPYDPLGWQYRNCTSYAFWRLAQAKGVYLHAASFPHVANHGGGIGYSIKDFRNLYGYGNVNHNPNGATLAIEGAGQWGPGTYGHIMYVEGSYVSQYNALLKGRYSTEPVSKVIANDPNTWFVHM